MGEGRRLESGERGRARDRERETEQTGGREGYPLHCCVTGNLIERGRKGGRERSRMLKLDEKKRERTHWCRIPGESCGL